MTKITQKIKQNLTVQNIEDIENAIIKKVLWLKKEPRKKEPLDITVDYCGVDNNVTIATLSVNIDNVLHIKSGISVKRKGDQYNKRAGQILALIDMI